ncbi:MAG TPA: alpha/beta hydrolase [Caldimonas sp.]|jgi:acetyl esterase|nr:alpha/beta hydrolase [Caldimonas sp.]HEX4236170.1 alpha/beta hydrolase [Caldimonas sp.]
MLHPDARTLIDLIAARGLPATHTLTPVDARAFYRDRRGFTQPPAPDVGGIVETRCDGPHGAIALRIYRPIGAGATATRGAALLPALVYYHGGGWTIGDLDTHDVLCRQLCNGAGAVVVAVDYRMGPEHRFPAAVDDCLAATYWVRRQAAELGVDANRLAVGGDSAGGNLAAVVAILARDAGDLPIAYQLLIYPATDMRRGHPSHKVNGSGYLLTTETIDYYHDHYVADPAHDLDWRASPLLHPDVSRLPPALVITAGFDPLRDEGLEYADRLVAAGNRAAYVCFERQIHGFITMGRVIDEAHAAVNLCAAELARALGR